MAASIGLLLLMGGWMRQICLGFCARLPVCAHALVTPAAKSLLRPAALSLPLTEAIVCKGGRDQAVSMGSDK